MRVRDLRDLLSGDMAKIHRALATRSDRESWLRRALGALRRWSEPSGPRVIKLPYCPPLALFWSWRAPEPHAPAQALHRAFLHEAWRERAPLARIALLARLALLWLPVNAAICAWSSALNARAVKRCSGKGVARQLAEQLVLLAAHDLRAISYYCFELYDDALRRRAADYIQRSETKGGSYLLIKRFLPSQSKLANKLRFFERCEAHGIRSIPVLAVAEKGSLRVLAGDTLPRADLFVKPKNGRGGVGAEWWAYDGSRHLFRGSGGGTLPESGLVAYLVALARHEAYVVGPRLANHPALADLGNGALSTARIVTILNEHGVPEATDAVFRMAIGSNRIVDNFHAGGLAASVDMKTGELGRATDLGLRPEIGWRDAHPTGAVITGRKLPFWPEALELAKRAHAAFADRVAIGWDVAFLADGPSLVEGNGGPDLDIHQRCARTPVGATRLGELLAFHTQRALEARRAQEQR